MAGMVSGLTQVCATRLGPQMRPQGIHDLIPHEAVAVGQREELHQLRGTSTRPRSVRDLLAVDDDSKSTEQLEAYARRMISHHHSNECARWRVEHSGHRSYRR